MNHYKNRNYANRNAPLLPDDHIEILAASIMEKHPRNPEKQIVETGLDMERDGYSDEFVRDLVIRLDRAIANKQQEKK